MGLRARRLARDLYDRKTATAQFAEALHEVLGIVSAADRRQFTSPNLATEPLGVASE